MTRLPRILAVVVLVLAGVLYTRHLDAWRIDDDEEGYLYAAWRIDEGELPYGDFLTPQLPGFLYPGAAVVRLAGAGDATAPRAWSVLLVLVAAAALFVAGSDLIGPWGGLLAMTVFLLSEDVYLIATAFRPEPTMLAATVAALAFFVRGELRERPGLFVVASLLFGVGLLAKLFSALPWIAAGVYLTCDGLFCGRGARRTVRDLAFLALPGGLLVALVMGGFVLAAPETLGAVLGHQLRQGADLSEAQVIAKTVSFYRSALERNTTAFAFVPVGILALLVLAGRIGWLAFWQVASMVAFFLLSRQLFQRHLVYLGPTLALCFAASFVWFAVATGVLPWRDDEDAARDTPWRFGSTRGLAALALALFVGTRLVVQLSDVVGDLPAPEAGTAAVAAAVRALTPEGAAIVADTPGPAYYAGRPTTYAAAGLSEGAAGSGQITGAELLQEMADAPVALVLVDQTEGGQLASLHDYDAFLSALAQRYHRLGFILRHDMRLDVYGEAPAEPVKVDGVHVLGAQPRVTSDDRGGWYVVTVDLAVTAEPGAAGELDVTIAKPGAAPIASSRVVLANAVGTGPSGWQPGEMAGLTASLPIPPDALDHARSTAAYTVGLGVPGGPVVPVATVYLP